MDHVEIAVTQLWTWCLTYKTSQSASSPTWTQNWLGWVELGNKTQRVFEGQLVLHWIPSLQRQGMCFSQFGLEPVLYLWFPFVGIYFLSEERKIWQPQIRKDRNVNLTTSVDGVRFSMEAWTSIVRYSALFCLLFAMFWWILLWIACPVCCWLLSADLVLWVSGLVTFWFAACCTT